jgi:hypothetical protein
MVMGTFCTRRCYTAHETHFGFILVCNFLLFIFSLLYFLTYCTVLSVVFVTILHRHYLMQHMQDFNVNILLQTTVYSVYLFPTLHFV